MNLKLLRGYFLAFVALLILVAAAILVILNIGVEWSIHFFVAPITPSAAAAMIVIGACGVVVWYTVVRLLPTAIRQMREGKKATRLKEAQRKLKSLEKEKSEPQ